MTETVKTRSSGETESWAADFASRLKGGEVLVLKGELGAGKTTFVRGLAAGLGADPGDVSSPSYTLVNVYSGDTTLVHVDLYRLGDESDIVELALEDLLEGGAVMAVEWGERLPAWFQADYLIAFSIEGDDERHLKVQKAEKE